MSLIKFTPNSNVRILGGKLSAGFTIPPRPRLYFTNQGGDGTINSGNFLWQDLNNWNTAADGSGSPAIGIPWTGDFYVNYDLLAIDSPSIYVYMSEGTKIGQTTVITGTCNVNLHGFFGNAEIYSGTFTRNDMFGVINPGNGTIYGGTFTGNDMFLEPNIVGGTFSGTGIKCFVGGNGITGGTFEINGFQYMSGTIDYTAIHTTFNGVPYTGDFNGNNYVNGNYVP
jgi:hypothetical protein